MNTQKMLIAAFVLLSLRSGQISMAQQKLPYLRSVVLSVNVERDRGSGMYLYKYAAENGEMSNGNIIEVEIDISRSPGQVSYDTTGLHFYQDGWIEDAFRREYPVVEGLVVPVGFPEVPTYWEAALTNYQTAAFFNDGRNEILPGKLLSGFEMTSRGLPGVRRFKASPDYDPSNYYPSMDDVTSEQADSIAAEVDSDYVRLPFWGYTLGPSSPPLHLSASAWIDTLTSYKHQCVTLGWLRNDKSREHECEETMRGKDWYMKEEVGKMRNWEVDESWDFDRDWNSGIAEILDKRLDVAKRAMTKGDSVLARRDLQIFVMEVELVNRLGGEREGRSQKSEIGGQKPAMTSEAHALLKYNAEYLIDRLPEKHGKGDQGGSESKK